MNVFSFGGGVQSTAALVLAAQKQIPYNVFVFANTGDDSENPATLDYLHNVHIPFAKKHGLTLEITSKHGPTLYEHCMSDRNRTIAIPMRMSNGAPGTRKCTSDWKIKPIARWTKENGATRKEPCNIGIGISSDEWHRAKDSRIAHQAHDFPLLKISRMGCANIIRDAGLPIPPKSSCWFCPYKKVREWQEMATNEPELFEKAAKLEAKLEAKRGQLGKDKLYLTDRSVPLQEAVLASDQLSLFGDEECTGYCWS